MIFNGEVIGIEKDVKKYRNNPKLTIGTVIEFLYDDTESALPGCKRVKKGKYVVVNIRPPFMSHGKSLVYVIKCNRSNATYEWGISTECIDYCIHKGFIRRV